MDQGRDNLILRKHTFKIALFFSLLCHLLFLSCFDFFDELTALLPLAPSPFETPDAESEPLVFELVETPRSAAVSQAPDDARFLSDKNARAQDMQSETASSENMPFSRGETGYKVFAGQQQGRQGMSQRPPSRQVPNAESADDPDPNSEAEEQEQYGTDGEPVAESRRQSYQPFNPEMLRGSRRSGQSDFSDDLNWNQQQSSVKNRGQFSLSTYNWEWAPYIQYMKARLRDHNYPPPAFYRMGAISGEVDIKFRILKDGQVQNLELIKYSGHKALAQTALNAVRASDPFRPLPDDFPDKHLDLSWKFIYFIQR